MKRHHKIPYGRPVGNVDGSIAAKETNKVQAVHISDHQHTSEEPPQNSYKSKKSSISINQTLYSF